MSDHAPIDPAKLRRQKRLEETLKENLRRRKAQARARSQTDPDPDAGGPVPEPGAADPTGGD